jgi:hypothetical protein
VEDEMSNRPGCLVGLLKLFLLRLGFDWAQDSFGYGRGGCMGCGCGTILLILFVVIFLRIVFGTDWLHLVYTLPVLWMI